MDQPKPQQKDDKKPAIPTLRESTERAQIKIKGLQSGQSLLERLKQFKKKDLAFILAGLGVLFMAPLAEHFLMSPDNGQSGIFQQGWGFKPGQNGIGQGGSPFEPGAGGLAPGDLAGADNDVITPLNVRDPSALIMGPSSSAQPPAVASNAGAQPSGGGSSWKDALAQAPARAAAAASSHGLPVPRIPLTNGALRGLGVVSGGGGASYTLPPISAGAVPNRGGGGGSLGLAHGGPGYQGPAGARGLTNGGSMEALKAAAAKAGSDFNRPGAAGAALQKAASTNMGSGTNASGGAGQGGSGLGADKGPGASQNKDSKSEGESLAFLAAKENQQKAIDLQWKLIEKQKMLWPNLKEKMLDALTISPLNTIMGTYIGDMMMGSAGIGFYDCKKTGGGQPLPDGQDIVYPASQVQGWCNGTQSTSQPAQAAMQFECFQGQGNNPGMIYGSLSSENETPIAMDCTHYLGNGKDATGPAAPPAHPPGSAAHGNTGLEDASGGGQYGGNNMSLDQLCARINQFLSPQQATASSDIKGTDAADRAGIMSAMTSMQAAAQQLAAAEYLITGNKSINCAPPQPKATPGLETNMASAEEFIWQQPNGVYKTFAAFNNAAGNTLAAIKQQESKVGSEVPKTQPAAGSYLQNFFNTWTLAQGAQVQPITAVQAVQAGTSGQPTDPKADLMRMLGLQETLEGPSGPAKAKGPIETALDNEKIVQDAITEAKSDISSASIPPTPIAGADQKTDQDANQLRYLAVQKFGPRLSQDQAHLTQQVGGAIGLAQNALKSNVSALSTAVSNAYQAAAQPAANAVPMLPQSWPPSAKDSSFLGQVNAAVNPPPAAQGQAPPDPSTAINNAVTAAANWNDSTAGSMYKTLSNVDEQIKTTVVGGQNEQTTGTASAATKAGAGGN